jgi:uncharacterized protein YggU (UPF0235/DUF167 family)
VRQADDQLKVWTKAPAIDGRANEAVCGLIADWLGVPASAVTMVRGAHGRVKLIEVRR